MLEFRFNLAIKVQVKSTSECLSFTSQRLHLTAISQLMVIKTRSETFMMFARHFEEERKATRTTIISKSAPSRAKYQTNTFANFIYLIWISKRGKFQATFHVRLAEVDSAYHSVFENERRKKLLKWSCYRIILDRGMKGNDDEIQQSKLSQLGSSLNFSRWMH